MHIRISDLQIKQLLDNRANSTVSGGKRRYTPLGKSTKKRIFAEIKRDHNLPAASKLVMFLDNPANPLYGCLRDKRSRLPLDDGRVAPVEIAEEEDFDFESEFNALLSKALEEGMTAASTKTVTSKVHASIKSPSVAKKVAKPVAAKKAAPAKKPVAAKKAPVAKKLQVKAKPKAAVKAPAKVAKKR
jgi:hypothetical protein